MASRDLEQFRRAFRAGERVAGKVLSRPDAQHAWVNISGYELLARTDTDPQPGTVLSFFIAQLSPVVVLRELPRPGQASPETDPRQADILTRGFRAARAELEARPPDLVGLPPHSWPPGDNLAALKASFLSRLRKDAPAWAAFSRVARLVRDINTLAVIRTTGRFLYAPWYPPGATEHELFLGVEEAGGIREILLAFRLAGPELVRVKALVAGGTARCLVSAQYPGELPRDGLLPDSLAMGRKRVRLELLARPRVLDPGEPSLLAGLLAPRPGSFTGVNLRV